MSMKLTQEQFTTRAKEIHGDNRYDYSKVEYVDSRTKVIITCPEHGEFEQAPSKHLRGQGCSKCRYDSLADKYKTTVEEFIIKSNEVHGDKYTYGKVDYIGSKFKVIITCSEHGDFEQSPNSHLSGIGCPHCANESKKLTQESFIQKANEVHDNKYDYSKVEYVSNRNKVKIGCHTHGEFEQVASNHLQGQGCPSCAKENSGFSRIAFVNKCESKDGYATLYVIECHNNTEEFIKFGITSDTIQERYKDKNAMPYNYRVLAECTAEPEMIWNIEKGLKREMRLSHYVPQIVFKGSATECFVRTEE